jgi:hypothetical protein
VRASTLSFAHETAGAARIRHSLRPPVFEGNPIKTRAHRAAGTRSHVWSPCSSFYGDDWEVKFRETEMIEKNDTHFNLHQFPNAWIVIGLFYPQHETTRDMFFN